MIRLLLPVALLFAYLYPAAHAQQPTSPHHIGVLFVSWSLESKIAQALREGLREVGYAEEKDVVIEWRTASGDYARLPALAADLVERKVEVIVVAGTVAAQAVKRATSTIPIVIVNVADPVGSGLVTNLAHPGGNVTGFSNMVAELSAKRLQLLKEAIPRVTRMAVLRNPDTPWQTRVIDDPVTAPPNKAVNLTRLLPALGPRGGSSRIQIRSCTVCAKGQTLPVIGLDAGAV